MLAIVAQPPTYSTPMPAEGSGAAKEREIVVAAQRGSDEAFSALVRLHQRRAYAIVRAIVLSHEDAEDAVQEGFLHAHRALDRAPQMIGLAVQPRYPESLRAAGITGRVVVQFVVDTTGRAEPGSVEVQESPRPEFADAVRAALPRFRFTPGEVNGRKVRTRVQLPFEFSLSR